MAAHQTPRCHSCNLIACSSAKLLSHSLPEPMPGKFVDTSRHDVVDFGYIILGHVRDGEFLVYTSVLFPASEDAAVNPSGLIGETMWVCRDIGPLESPEAVMAAVSDVDSKGIGYLANSPSLSSGLNRGDVVSYSGGSAQSNPKFERVLRRATVAELSGP